MSEWQIVNDDESGDRVRRFPVPGGWLYQSEVSVYTHREAMKRNYGWSDPVFVAEEPC